MDAFDACIRNGRLKPFEVTEEALRKEITTSLEELKKAHSFFKDGRYEDTIVQAYFGMYRSAKSLLLAGGYRDTNLYSLVAGITRLYVTPGAIDPELVDLLKIINHLYLHLRMVPLTRAMKRADAIRSAVEPGFTSSRRNSRSSFSA